MKTRSHLGLFEIPMEILESIFKNHLSAIKMKRKVEPKFYNYEQEELFKS